MTKLPIVDQSYPCTFTDLQGQEQIALHNDGQEIRTTIRGVTFTSADIECWSPVPGTEESLLDQFSISALPKAKGVEDWELHDFRLDFRMPLPIGTAGGRVEGSLRVHMRYGKVIEPDPECGVDSLKLWLTYNGFTFESSGTKGWFEDDLTELMGQMPEGDFIQACINCQWSDYHPVGNGMFGGMLCLKNHKEVYQRAKGKHAFLQLLHPDGQKLPVDYVQETFRCSEYMLRMRNRVFGYT